jgi:uncharacterized delta-60 repeat protein
VAASGFVVALLTTLPLGAAAVGPVVLDPSFGRSGLVRTDLGSGRDDHATALVIQRDGKLVVAGSSGREGAPYDFALVRYLPSGAVDTRFGSGGKAFADFGGRAHDVGQGAALQPDGKIVVVGGSDPAGDDSPWRLAVARFNAGGALDPGFGSGGRVMTDFPPSSSGHDLDIGYAVALQPDRKIVVAGEASGRFSLVRYTADGALDKAFGANGKVVTAVAPPLQRALAQAIAIQPDGRIVIGGLISSIHGFVLGRYRPDGRLDASFGSGGIVRTDVGLLETSVRALVLQRDGKIVAAGSGYRRGGGNTLGVARYESNGRLDATFGAGGRVLTPIRPGSSDARLGALVQRDGRIVVAGGGEFLLARYRRNGRLDTAFAGTGLVTADFGRSRHGKASALAVQPDGKLVAAGTTVDAQGDNGDFALARYLPGDWRGTRFTSLTVTQTVPGYLVKWRTALEVGTRGFNIYRESIQSRRLRVNGRIVQAVGSRARGRTYSFIDRPQDPVPEPLVYWLEEITRAGRTWYGPIVSVAQASRRAFHRVLRRDLGAATSPAPGTIAFVRYEGESSDDTVSEVYTARGDGTGIRPVTKLGDVDAASWSPDRRWLALTRGETVIYVVRSAGGRPRRLTYGRGGASSPSWSADGRLIAFAAEKGVWISTRTGAMRRFATGHGAAWHPSRPRTLAYVGADGVYVASVGDRRHRRIFASKLDVRDLSWSPDGRRIAAGIATAAQNSEIYALSVGVRGAVNLSRDESSSRNPAWSPDSRRMAWAGDDGVWIANANGSGKRRLSSEPASRSMPAWSPDGRSIVFSGAFGVSCTLYLVHLAGGAAQPLLQTRDQPSGANGCDIAPVWFR